MVEKQEVGDKTRADNNNTERAKDVVQADGTPGAQETRLKLKEGDEGNDSKICCQLGCCHGQLQPSGNKTNCNFESFRIVWDSLEKYLLRILPRLPQSETVDNSAKTDFAPSIKVMSVNCCAKISLTPQKIATYNM